MVCISYSIVSIWAETNTLLPDDHESTAGGPVNEDESTCNKSASPQEKPGKKRDIHGKHLPHMFTSAALAMPFLSSILLVTGALKECRAKDQLTSRNGM